ncbi:MAG: metalloregulator ArsR/SmtB family transcription factor [Armatimonadota bacterium]|nr:metalloregulator ArsR/SmtB family transcription factor [Armatimonadota bacterium]
MRPALLLKAKLFRGFADPSRLAVLEALRGGPRCVSDVVAATSLSQPNVSAHLACLVECGLARSARQGRFVYYAIADDRALKILEEAEAILGGIGSEVFRCTRYDPGPRPRPRRAGRRAGGMRVGAGR